MHSKNLSSKKSTFAVKAKKSLMNKFIASASIVFSVMLISAAVVYAAWTNWPPGSAPLAAPGAGNVQLSWTDDGTNIYRASGKVGIGTTDPQYTFQVQSLGHYYTLGAVTDTNGVTASGFALGTNSALTESAIMAIDDNSALWINSGYDASGALQPLTLQSQVGGVVATRALRLNYTGISVDMPIFDIHKNVNDWIYAIFPWVGDGSYNPITSAGDVAIIFGEGAADTNKNLVIAPWSSTASGIKIMADGKVGIGTATPAGTLDIKDGQPNTDIKLSDGWSVIRGDGRMHIQAGVNSTADPNNWGDVGAGNLFLNPWTGAGDVVVGGGDTTSVHNLIVYNGSIQYSGSITDVSDKRLKENIVKIDNSISKIQNIDGVYFNMIGSDKRELGVLAQDVQKVLPESVNVIDVENGYLGVDYISLVPVLIEAVKEQQIQIENLEKELQDLKYLTN